ncbi:HipA domain-containing protein [Dyella sp. 7MK23]|uniref:HipA domain-containing protein n=1 Tax=Dyella acidiphila TaxID=2775866 RepID=A0ABR9G6Q4_9GAMM|nr:HipA domain-containing protein [Dyella acidiphila]
MVCANDGSIRLPAAGEITTHILKPDSLRIPGLRALEAFGLRLAKAIDLDVIQVQMIEVADVKALLVERYDRELDAVGELTRLHQEDFCQALGYPGELKYEASGGPSLAQCARLIRESRLGPAAVKGLLDWLLFNVLMGNADAHAKNLALLCDRKGRRKLAPFYDLVPTIAIAEQFVERQPALRIGTSDRIDEVTPEDLRSFASACGYAPSFVLRRLASMIHDALRCAPMVAALLVEQGAMPERIENALDKVRGNMRRMAQQLR